MNDAERWIHFDGPEPEHIRRLLDALRDGPEPSAEDSERMERGFLEALDAVMARRDAAGAPDGASAGHERGNDGGAPGARPAASGRVVEEGVTARSPAVASGRVAADAADFPEAKVDRGPVVVVIGDAGATASPIVGPAPDLAETAEAVEIPAEYRGRGAWPFRPQVPGQARAAKTLQAEVMKSGLGETLEDDAELRAALGAVLPFAGNTIGTGRVPFPKLTMRQYASLRVELSSWPEHAGEILNRYHVLHEAARAALDAHWEGQLAGAGARAELEKEMAEYDAWLRGRR